MVQTNLSLAAVSLTFLYEKGKEGAQTFFITVDDCVMTFKGKSPALVQVFHCLQIANVI